MKKLVYTVSTFCMLFSIDATAAEEKNNVSSWEIGGEVGLASDYRDRGVSLNKEEPALQASLEAVHSSGFVFGIDASTVSLDESSLELAPYAGYRVTHDTWTYEAGLTYTAYPGDDIENTHELEPYVSLSYVADVAQVTLRVDQGLKEPITYPSIEIVVPLPHDLELAAHAGYQFISDHEAKDYADWSLDLSYGYEDYTFGVAYVGASLSESDDPHSGHALVVHVSRAF